MKNRISLKNKITYYLTVFTLGLIALLLLFQTVLLAPMYERYKTAAAVKAGDQTVEALLHDDNDILLDNIYRISVQNDVCVRIMRNGSELTAGNIGCPLNRLSEEEIQEQIIKARQQDNRHLEQYSMGYTASPNDTELRALLYTRIVQTDDTYMIIMTSSGLSPIDATIVTLRMQIGYIGLIVFAAMLLLAWVMARHIVRPLASINRAAKELGEGKYGEVNTRLEYKEAEELNQTLQQASSAIQKADKAKRDLLSNVSHDLRTPLTLISGYGKMMQELPDEKTDENLQIIVEEAKRMTLLVNDLLDLSALEADRITLHEENFDLCDLVREETRKFEVFMSREMFTFSLDASHSLPVKADRNRMIQVFYNLLSNAIHYSADSRHICIRAFCQNGMAHVEIQDFGKGIDIACQKDIWERYYKVDQQHARNVTGSGIGLSIVREILEKHHAQYGVQSRPGSGSTFWFALPLLKDARVE